MKLLEVLAAITPLRWRFVDADNDKVTPTVRMFGRRETDPTKKVCFGRLDSCRDARYACHAANVLPDAVKALRLLLDDRPRAESVLSTHEFEFCEPALMRAEIMEPTGDSGHVPRTDFSSAIHR